MKKDIVGMGKIKFEKFYDEKNKKINDIQDNPIVDSKLVKKVDMKEVKELIDNEYIFGLLKNRKKINIYQTNPRNLLSKYRFDVLVKYYYVKSYVENNNVEESTLIYLNHIEVFNGFCEPDGKKSCKDDFINSFNELIQSIEKNRNLDKTIIPISMTGIPIDGAHRLACAIYFRLPIKYAVFDLLDGEYDKYFFIKRGMKKEYVEKVEKETKNVENIV